MSDWSGLKRDALRAQPFNSTDYAVASLGSRASDVLELIAENESLRADAERYRLLRNTDAEHGVSIVNVCEWTAGATCIALTYIDGESIDEAVDAAISSPENP